MFLLEAYYTVSSIRSRDEAAVHGEVTLFKQAMLWF